MAQIDATPGSLSASMACVATRFLLEQQRRPATRRSRMNPRVGQHGQQ